jgi:hypothetical protein
MYRTVKSLLFVGEFYVYLLRTNVVFQINVNKIPKFLCSYFSLKNITVYITVIKVGAVGLVL